MRHKLVLCLRYTLQVISLGFFVFLLTKLFYPIGWKGFALNWISRLDPWGLISHIRWQHNFSVWGWLPFLTLVITLFFGRVFCGWFCPFGSLLMLVDKIGRLIFKNKHLKKLSVNRKKVINKLQPLKYFWLLFLVITFIAGFNWAYSLSPFALFSREILEILRGHIPLALIFIIIITLLFSRLWCSVLCPTGLLLSFFSRFRIFRYQTTNRCVHCSKCKEKCSACAAPAGGGAAKEGCLVCAECQDVCPVNAISFQSVFRKKQYKEKIDEAAIAAETENKHTRREFIKITGTSLLAAAAAFGGKTIQAAKKTLRPPGAISESEFTSVCNRCGRCIKACPNEALHPMPITDGIECFDTPQLIPRNGNCSLCLTCQEVCPTGAIKKVPLEQVHIGKAVIDKQRCLAWGQNKLCLICGEQCPMLAIEGDEKQRPIIHIDQCVGCGTCEKSCAVIGEAAIRVHPQ